jgi:hypothetical protein
MKPTTSMLKNQALVAGQYLPIDLFFQETAGTVTHIRTELEGSMIIGVAATPFTQAAVDALIGSGQIVATTVFNATAMGTDSFGFVLDCNEQIADVQNMQYTFWLATEVSNNVAASATEPPGTLTEALYKTPNGNIVGRVIPAGFDAGTAVLQIRIWVKLK